MLHGSGAHDSSLHPPSLAHLIDQLAHLLPALDQFDAHGLAPFLPRYSALDLLAGRQVRVEEAGQLHEGVAIGLAADGALKVALGGGERCFHAGEVSVRPA